jgi:hypothetical protein
MQDVPMKLNYGLPWPQLHSTKDGFFHQQIEFKFKEETSKWLPFQLSFV